ncbi:hypothetical protein F5X68DRAFT_266834 [Plectosphaerella plurivora]|uniref:Uncharacterized protein n=1 Tax=Plectosphaerella plurivora TaxID=936078 RepID=A0A9P9ACG9_9PEZI|nr:hypothetical protein F5X68DRAFT_266834 [Plectosphaerella plurivora]
MPGSPMPGSYQFRGSPGRRRSKKAFAYAMLTQWFFILLFIGAMYAVLGSYTRETVLSRSDKRIFNTLVTGVAIALALMTISYMNGLVIELRWWMLSRRYRSRRKVESILHAHSLRRAIALAFTSKRVSIHFYAVGWILLLLASQAGLASLNLCFVLETNEVFALLLPGNVSIPDLRNIHTNRVVHTSKSVAAQQYTANQFGTIALAFPQAGLAELPAPGTLFYSDDPLVFCDDEGSMCRYQFHEINTASENQKDRIPIEAATDRSVITSAECRSYPVIQGGNGTSLDLLVDLRNGEGDKQNVTIPFAGGPDQTTFMTDTSGTGAPARNGSASACGPRCVSIAAFEATSTGQAWFYDCTVTVGQVSNTKRPEHELGLNLTRMAAAGIALQGYASTLTANGGNASNTDLRDQAMIYPSESWWGTPVNGSTQGMAYLLARFSIGVVAIAAENNDRSVVWGEAPNIGIRVKMEHWPIVHVILILTAVLLLLLGCATAYLGNLVVVPAPGPVAEAQVLKAMMASERGGRFKKGDCGRRGVAHEGRKTVWIYRDQLVGGGVYDLYMEETEVAVTTQQPKEKFGWFKRRKGTPEEAQSQA